HQRQHLPGSDREVRRHPAAGDVLRWADRGRSGRAGGEGMMDVQAQTGGAAAPEAASQATAGGRSGAPLAAAADAPEAADSAALSPAEWQFASAQRAGLYAWFSRLYAYEVSEHMYRSHFADGGVAPFAGLDELGLATEVQRLDAAIATLRAEQLPRLE